MEMELQEAENSPRLAGCSGCCRTQSCGCSSRPGGRGVRTRLGKGHAARIRAQHSVGRLESCLFLDRSQPTGRVAGMLRLPLWWSRRLTGPKPWGREVHLLGLKDSLGLWLWLRSLAGEGACGYERVFTGPYWRAQAHPHLLLSPDPCV